MTMPTGANPQMGDALMPSWMLLNEPRDDTHDCMLRMFGLTRSSPMHGVIPSRSVQMPTLPTDELTQRLRDREWTAAKDRLSKFPSDARYRQENRATPLHLACFYRAPHDLVTELTCVYPQALLEQDSEGWTPLHVQLLYGTNKETAVMLIRRGGAEAAARHARLVGSPLHLACRHLCGREILEALLQIGPTQVCRRNEAGCFPASLLYKSALRLEPNGCASRDTLDRLALLVVAARNSANKKKKKRETPSLHEIINFQREYAHDTDLVGLTLQLDPDKAQALDGFGRTPLHVAASYPPPTRSPMARWSLPADPLEAVLDCHVTAVDETDSLGRLPIHIALQNGRGWWTGVSRLVAAGSRLDRPCPGTGLFCFQLAAAAATLSSRSKQHKEPEESSVVVVETAFELLRACPHVIDTRCLY